MSAQLPGLVVIPLVAAAALVPLLLFPRPPPPKGARGSLCAARVVLGCGTGDRTQRLRRRWPDAQVVGRGAAPSCTD